jgi:hypothetical protein
MKLKSTFALLDVKGRERHKLARHFKDAPRSGETPVEFRIPVTITGYISGQWGGDDGTSIEFSVQVDHVEAAR